MLRGKCLRPQDKEKTVIKPLNNQRRRDFADWIDACVPVSQQREQSMQLQPLAGDAGFRRYFRLAGQPSLIAVDSPPDKENNPAYIAVAMAFQRQGITTPKILAVDFSHGFLLLEDFGYQLLHAQLLAGVLAEEDSPERLSAANYYHQAEAVLLAIQTVAADPRVFSAYDQQRLQVEMDLFTDWFVGRLLGISLLDHEREMLSQLFTVLIDSAVSQPQVVVHRDYHSRNLMLLEDGALGVIDFQDAVIGPITYDLVSLLKDCYLRLPEEQVIARALAYKKRLEAELAIGSIGDDEFLRWFDLIGLQRHIKVLGIFARLSLRDGKQGYLKDLPLVIRYTLEAAQRYPEGQLFCRWFVERIEPLLPAQDWYSDWRSAGEFPAEQQSAGDELQ
ncbi:phosphotransferase [bacterium]|nr:phosphotransferase [bacterium]